MKSKIKSLINLLIKLTIKTRLGLYVLRNLLDSAMGKYVQVSHADLILKEKRQYDYIASNTEGFQNSYN